MIRMTVYVADGSLISQHPDIDVERILGRIRWTANNDRIEAGSFYQQSFTAEITYSESLLVSGIVDNILLE